MDKLSHVVSIRLTDKQMELVSEKAKAQDITVPVFLRSIAVGTEFKAINVALSDMDKKVLYDFKKYVVPALIGYNKALNAVLAGISDEEREKIVLGKHNMKEWAEAVDIVMRYAHKYSDYLDRIYEGKNN